VSFGHAAFFGIGGCAVAVSNFRGGSPCYGAIGGALLAVAEGLFVLPQRRPQQRKPSRPAKAAR